MSGRAAIRFVPFPVEYCGILINCVRVWAQLPCALHGAGRPAASPLAIASNALATVAMRRRPSRAPTQSIRVDPGRTRTGRGMLVCCAALAHCVVLQESIIINKYFRTLFRNTRTAARNHFCRPPRGTAQQPPLFVENLTGGPCRALRTV